MPSMLDHESNKIVKVLVAADGGSGKTGALASLVDEGFNLRVLDFDNGLSPLRNYTKVKAHLANVRYASLRDELELVGGKMVIKKANAFSRAMALLDKGGGDFGEDVGPLKTWGPREVLVVDTLGMMARSCLLMVMEVNSALHKNPEIQHYGVAMENIERFLGQLTSSAVGCNVIINTHLYRNEDSPKLYPESLGSKLGPKLSRYFDNFWSISMTGANRTIKTSKDGLLALKCAMPLKDQYDISDGYAKIFKELTGVAKLSDLWTTADAV